MFKQSFQTEERSKSLCATISWTTKSNDYVNFYFRSSKPKSYQKQLMIKTPEIKV